MTADDLSSQRNNRNSGYLADVRHGSGGTRVYLDDVNFVICHDELNVDHALDMQRPGQLLGVIHQFCLDLRGNARCRIYGDTVSGMHASTLDVLHNARNQDIGTVTYGVDLDFLTYNIFIYKDRMILRDLVDDADEFVNIVVVDADLHTLSAKNVGRSYQNRIAQVISCFLCFLSGKYSMSGRSRDLAFLQDLIEELTVLCCVHILCRSTKNRNPHLHQGLGQLDGSLSTELNDSAVRLLNVYNALHILLG